MLLSFFHNILATSETAHSSVPRYSITLPANMTGPQTGSGTQSANSVLRRITLGRDHLLFILMEMGRTRASAPQVLSAYSGELVQFSGPFARFPNQPPCVLSFMERLQAVRLVREIMMEFGRQYGFLSNASIHAIHVGAPESTPRADLFGNAGAPGHQPNQPPPPQDEVNRELADFARRFQEARNNGQSGQAGPSNGAAGPSNSNNASTPTPGSDAAIFAAAAQQRNAMDHEHERMGLAVDGSTPLIRPFGGGYGGFGGAGFGAGFGAGGYGGGFGGRRLSQEAEDMLQDFLDDWDDEEDMAMRYGFGGGRGAFGGGGYGRGGYGRGGFGRGGGFY